MEAVFWQKYGSKLKEVKQVDGNKKSASIKLSLQDGSTFLCEARFQELEYRSFKSCKDFRKNKESTLSLPLLESLKGSLLTPTVRTSRRSQNFYPSNSHSKKLLSISTSRLNSSTTHENIDSKMNACTKSQRKLSKGK